MENMEHNLSENQNNDIIGIEEENIIVADVLPITERWEPLGADNDDDNVDINSSQNTKYDTEKYINGHPLKSSASSTSIVTTDCEQYCTVDDINVDTNRIKSLEDEQEMLTTSLMALTSHFAQVQFRLRQIVEAEPIDRDKLLKNLEEFAFRGIPEITKTEKVDSIMEDNKLTKNVSERQFELIDRLKEQLTELENFAYESGSPVLPQSVILEKQKIIIDELKNKLNLNVNYTDLPNLTHDDLRSQIDTAIGEFVGPLKMKEQLVIQLKTQITDLERFIAFLQYDEAVNCESNTNTLNNFDNSMINTTSLINNIDKNNKSPQFLTKIENSAYNSYSAKKKAAARLSTQPPSGKSNNFNDIKKTQTENLTDHFQTSQPNNENHISLNKKAHNVLDKISTILQMFAISQIGCSSSKSKSNFHTNSLKRNQYCNHWGDIRAQLEVDVQEILGIIRSLNIDRERIASLKSQKNENNKSVVKNLPTTSSSLDQQKSVIINQHRCNSKDNMSKKTSTQPSMPLSSLYSSISITNAELTTIIRRNFACTLQKLIQHGLRIYSTATNNLLVPFMGCFAPFTSTSNYRASTSNYEDDWNKKDVKRHRQGKTYFQSNKKHDNFSDNTSHIDQLLLPSTRTTSSLPSDEDFNIDEDDRQMHAWELILEYYKLKNGESYNDTPVRKLSQSFNLDIVGSQATTNKESLLCAIANIITIHSPYKRSFNSHFKAFVCAALNSHKLVHWLCLIFESSDLINTFYEPWAYVMRTGFRDALRTIECLTQHNFDLPIDLAVRQFENIKDAF